MLTLKNNRKVTFLCLVVLIVALAALFIRWRSSIIQARYTRPAATRLSSFPRLILWAWERPEHLGFINPREVGVAFLAETVKLSGNTIITHPRLQPLDVPVGTTLIAVVRIESSRVETATLSSEQRALIVDALIQIGSKPKVSALQIDFDATQSEREFYGQLLNDVRRRLPESLPLSMTALASWCIFDNWMDDLPVDEAVPMLFQMGIDQHRITDYINSGGRLRSSLCLQSVGISTDETIVPLSNVPRVYVFNRKPWSEETVNTALERSRNETSIP